ncbi:hypothetical protein JVU11DRAFT_1929 [Chiua virens]|nr:hypothetical protein JVU11DRAFT_1929 [Chiua virens]
MSMNSYESFKAYTQGAEQDVHGDGDLPTYDDLAAQHSSPNSRFGRWRGWIEKRAAERYTGLSEEELARRRARGWGDTDERDHGNQVDDPNTRPASIVDPSRVAPAPLRIRIDRELPEVPGPSLLNLGPSLQASATSCSPADPLSQSSQDLQGTVCETLSPTHLQLHQFGSRFLPHTTSPIRCILPINRDRLLLIGTDHGLSVLDMYPMEWATDGDVGIVHKGPGEAQARVLWSGEAVYQMSILEHEDVGEGTPQGVVLALVGPDPDAPCASSGHQEPLRTLRMYNLASLTSLAKWTISQKGANPVDLRRASDWNIQQTPVKKHRPASSITRGLKHLIDSPTRTQQPATSYESYLAVPNAKRNAVTAPADASWDVVDDLPLRWATDFVPLAGTGSRLASSSVISYALWHDGPGPNGGRHGRRALLAVATKYNIFLYETPKGERAFHFVKEFYTPVQPRTLVFVHQLVQDLTRVSSEASSSKQTGYGHSRGASTDSHYSHNNRVPISQLTYSAQMAIFVTFEKKAGVIRIADAAVSEVDLYDAASSAGSFPSARDSLSVTSSLGSRRSRASIDFMAFKEAKGTWILPSFVDLPVAQLPGGDVSSEKSVYVLTRGKNTHIVPAPLPAVIQSVPPILALVWSSSPSSVVARVCVLKPSSPASARTHAPKRPQGPFTSPFLQLIAFSEDGIEVQEIPVAAIYSPTAGTGRDKDKSGKGKEKVALADPRRGQSFVGETGFLVAGGHWHRLPAEIAAGAAALPVGLERTDSVASGSSFGSAHTDEVVARLRAEAGVYGWLRKSVEGLASVLGWWRHERGGRVQRGRHPRVIIHVKRCDRYGQCRLSLSLLLISASGRRDRACINTLRLIL